WCYYTQRRAGRPRSSPPPLRGNCRLRRRERFGISMRFTPPLSAIADATAQRSVAHLTLIPPYVATTLRSPTHKPPHFVGGKPPSLTRIATSPTT
ncbi:MAG: hypothetical protein LBQ66_14570, partial [Planctomycetaceae bacterium]|nr:hypothetical protein [Planctomycetaceae bacterium]